MKRIIVVASLFVMLFVAVSPAFAGGPGRGGQQGGGQQGGWAQQAGQQVVRYGQRSAQGWGQAAQGTVVIAKAVGQQVAKDAQAVGRAAQRLNQSTVNAGDSARIGQALDNANSRAQGK
jgi:hypothetical protein